MDINTISQIFAIIASFSTIVGAVVAVATFIRQRPKDDEDDEDQS